MSSYSRLHFLMIMQYNGLILKAEPVAKFLGSWMKIQKEILSWTSLKFQVHKRRFCHWRWKKLPNLIWRDNFSPAEDPVMYAAIIKHSKAKLRKVAHFYRTAEAWFSQWEFLLHTDFCHLSQLQGPLNDKLARCYCLVSRRQFSALTFSIVTCFLLDC